MNTDNVSIQRRTVVVNVEAAEVTIVPNFVPKRCLFLACGWNVRTFPPGTTGFRAGVEENINIFANGGDPIEEVLNSNTGYFFTGTEERDLLITPDVVPSDNTGEIVLTIWYIDLENVL